MFTRLGFRRTPSHATTAVANKDNLCPPLARSHAPRPGGSLSGRNCSTPRGRATCSQLFFPDDLNNAVFANAPYEGNPDTSNDADGIFGQSDGTTLLEPEQSGDGYAATFSIALAVS